MRCYSIYLFVVFLSSINLLNAKNLQANFQYFSFQNEQGQNYIETYLTFLSSEINYQKVADNSYQGAILIELEILEGDSIKHIDKYIFNTPIVSDTLTSQYFIDKQIIALNNGDYTLNLKLKDTNTTKEALTARIDINTDISTERVSLSDLMLVDNYSPSTKENILSKSGYDIIPLANNGSYFLDDHQTQLQFYIEYYNSKEDSLTKDGFLIQYYIENYQTFVPITDFNIIKKRVKDYSPALLAGFDITNLVSGNYNLTVNILDRQGKPIRQKKIFFQRRNTTTVMRPEDYASMNYKSSFVEDFTIIEELAENISSLLPIATGREWEYASNQLEHWDLENMKQFFYGFWANRNPINPKEDWDKYYKAVQVANKQYATIKVKGFGTDRGYYYLKHGIPDFIEEVPSEANAFPYEIWHYYKLKDETNRIFVFVEMAIGTNDYELIHSNAIGEIHNENWQNIIYKINKDTYEFKKSNIIDDQLNYEPKSED